HPGFKQFIIRPAWPGATDVTWANASFESPVGTIKSNWSRKGGQLALEMTVPPNSVAWLQLATDEAVDISAYPSIVKPTEKNGFLPYKVLHGTYRLKQIAP